jgi:hypothetical protein
MSSNEGRRKTQGAIQAGYEASRFQFITSELDLAITFCHISLTTEDSEKAVRTADHAKKAYGAARRYFEDSHLTAEMKRTINDRIEKLTPLLAMLPKDVPLP